MRSLRDTWAIAPKVPQRALSLGETRYGRGSGRCLVYGLGGLVSTKAFVHGLPVVPKLCPDMGFESLDLDAPPLSRL